LRGTEDTRWRLGFGGMEGEVGGGGAGGGGGHILGRRKAKAGEPAGCSIEIVAGAGVMARCRRHKTFVAAGHTLFL